MRECPKCSGTFVEQAIDPRTKVRFCEKCRGIWLSRGQLARSIGKTEDWPDLDRAKAAAKASRYLCTDCGRAGLVTLAFRPSDPLEVELCPACEGLFLDFREFARAQELVRSDVRMAAAVSAMPPSPAVPRSVPTGSPLTGRVVPLPGNLEAARNDHLLGDAPPIPPHLVLKNPRSERIWRRAIKTYTEEHESLYPRWRTFSTWSKGSRDWFGFNPSIRNEFFFYKLVWKFTPYVKPPQYQPLLLRFAVLYVGWSAILVGLYTFVSAACVVPDSGSLYRALMESRKSTAARGGRARGVPLTGYPPLDLALVAGGILAWGFIGERRNALPPWAWYLAEAEKAES